MSAEQEIEPFIDYNREMMAQFFVFESINNFLLFPYLDTWPFLMLFDSMYKYGLYLMFEQDRYKD